MGNFLKSIFPFPFREIEYQKVNLSKEESHKLIDQLMEDYGKHEKYNDNVDIPIKEEKINLGYGDVYQGEPTKEWKAPTLDQLADYLEEEHRLLSDGKSMAIMSMVDFYRKNNRQMKKTYYIDVGNMTKEDAEKAIVELMQSYKDDINPRWLIEYDRKHLLKKRREKINQLNGIITFQ